MHSAVVVLVHSVGGGLRIESSISKLTSEEGLREFRRAWEILCREICLTRGLSIVHVRRLVQGVAHFQCVLGVVNLGQVISGEGLRFGLGKLNQLFVCLNFFMVLRVQFSACAHFLQHFVLVCPLRVLQSESAITLLRYELEPMRDDL